VKLYFDFLDYHNHADHIVSILIICAQCSSKTNCHLRAIQYATEALQYNKIDANALTCRAKAFENEKSYVWIYRNRKIHFLCFSFSLLFSYADYARIPSNDYGYPLAQRACEK